MLQESDGFPQPPLACLQRNDARCIAGKLKGRGEPAQAGGGQEKVSGTRVRNLFAACWDGLADGSLISNPVDARLTCSKIPPRMGDRVGRRVPCPRLRGHVFAFLSDCRSRKTVIQPPAILKTCPCRAMGMPPRRLSYQEFGSIFRQFVLLHWPCAKQCVATRANGVPVAVPGLPPGAMPTASWACL